MAERFTEFQLRYNMVDVTAKSDISDVNCDGAIALSAQDLLNNTSFPRIMSADINYSILDESLEEYDSNITTYGLLTSDDALIEITSNEYHSTSGLTLFFRGDPPESLSFEYFRDSVSIGVFEYNWEPETPIYDFSQMYTYSNGTYKFVSKDSVQLWNHIEIVITSIDKRSCIKIQGLLFGVVLDWDENKLKQGQLVQEINPISDTLSINTLNFELIDLDNELNFGNSNGLHKYFQRKQEMLPYEYVDGNLIPLGKFYLDTYSYELNLGKFSAVSFMGLMDGIPFNEGEIYNGVRAGVVIDKIFEVCEFTDYEVDSVTANQLLYGTITPMTAREALKQVLFACHSILDSTSSQQGIKICKASNSQTYAITRNTKITTKVTRNPYISGVEIDYQEYIFKNETTELHRETYEAGEYQVILSSPCSPSTITISGATKIKARPYYVEFLVANAGEVTILGKTYELKTNKVVSNRNYIDPGEIENIKKYSTSLCNANTAKDLSKVLLDYHTNQSLTLEIKHIADDISMNDLRTVQNEHPNFDDYLGVFSNRTFDLTGGFIDDAKLSAYFNLQNYYYYAGAENHEELFTYNGENNFTGLI